MNHEQCQSQLEQLSTKVSELEAKLSTLKLSSSLPPAPYMQGQSKSARQRRRRAAAKLH